jgi:hypothetical protein
VRAELRQDLEGHVAAEALLDRLVYSAHAAAGDLAQDAVVAQPLGDRRLARRLRCEQPGCRVAAGAELLDRDQGGEQLADLVGELWVFVGVLGHGRPLAAAVAVGEFVGQQVEQVGTRGRLAHGHRSAQSPKLVRISLSRRKART